MTIEKQTSVQGQNKYELRLVSTMKLAGYDSLSDEKKSVIANLAYDKDLDVLDFNELVGIELGTHKIIDDEFVEKAAHIAMSGLVQDPETSSEHDKLPKTFEEARSMKGASIEAALDRSDTSLNNPDDINFYHSQSLEDHMKGLHQFSDSYRSHYGRGNANLENKLAHENNMFWIQHNSLQFLKEENNGNKYPVGRIYLNSKLQDSLAIYKEIFAQATRRKLRFQSKILDPSGYRKELVQRTVEYHKTFDKSETRLDPIVFYAFEESKDELLEIVEDVYRKYSQSFEGRETGKIPLPLAPGMAIGEEPTGLSGISSLTSHRNDVIEIAKNDATAFRAIASSHHINPDNIAFNR